VVLDLEHGLVREDLSHELGVEGHVIVRGGVGSHLVEEFAEIVSDGQVDKDLLV